MDKPITILVVVTVILTIISQQIITTIPKEARVTKKPTWKPPVIPQCEKELWERVRNGCETGI